MTVSMDASSVPDPSFLRTKAYYGPMPSDKKMYVDPQSILITLLRKMFCEHQHLRLLMALQN